MNSHYEPHGGSGHGSRGGSRPGGHRPGGGSDGGQGSEDPKTILKGNETVRYRDTPDYLRRDLLDVEARKAAEDLGQISTTQLRRFFEQVTAIKRRLDLNRAIPEGEILAQVAFLKAAAAYAAGREKKNAPVLKFLVKHANSIKTNRDFLDFHRHFETVIAFHKVFEKKGNDQP